MGKVISKKELTDLVTYNKVTGEFYWKKAKRGVSVSKPMGSRRSNGCGNTYIKMRIVGYENYAHRLAFIYMNGSAPDFVDHIDGDGENNAWSNLRAVTKSENGKNSKRSKANTTGVTGIYRYGDRWRSYIYSNGRNTFLGCFDDKFEAICRRKSAERFFDFHMNHGLRVGINERL